MISTLGWGAPSSGGAGCSHTNTSRVSTAKERTAGRVSHSSTPGQRVTHTMQEVTQTDRWPQLERSTGVQCHHAWCSACGCRCNVAIAIAVRRAVGTDWSRVNDMPISQLVGRLIDGSVIAKRGTSRKRESTEECGLGCDSGCYSRFLLFCGS